MKDGNGAREIRKYLYANPRPLGFTFIGKIDDFLDKLKTFPPRDCDAEYKQQVDEFVKTFSSGLSREQPQNPTFMIGTEDHWWCVVCGHGYEICRGYLSPCPGCGTEVEFYQDAGDFSSDMLELDLWSGKKGGV